MRHSKFMMVSGLACSMIAGAASGGTYVWNWDRGGPGTSGLNDNGGRFESIDATFDTATKRLTWSVTFSDQVTQGFTLAVNNGPNPKGHAGELALLYVDARNAGDVKLTAYAYNGLNTSTSWKDGNGAVSGNQTADIVKNTLQRSSWVNSASVTDHDGKRTIAFDIDTTDLENHTPMYPDAVDPWYGFAFAEKIGLWMHPYRTFNPSYGEGGELVGLSTAAEGWFDGSNFNTTSVPTPGAAVLGAMGGLCFVRRRRAS